MSLVVALTRGDVADYVDALVTVYFVLILLNIMLSWVQQFRPIPYNLALRAVTGFIDETTTPYLNVFRRLGTADRPARPEPDRRDDPAVRRRRDRLGADPGVRPASASGWLRMAAVALVVVAVDQLSKGALRSALEPGEHRDLVLGFELSYVTNSGIAFGLLSEGANGVVLAVTLGALALVLGWFATDPTRSGPLARRRAAGRRARSGT